MVHEVPDEGEAADQRVRKAALRRTARAARADLGPAERHQAAAAVVSQLDRLPAMRRATQVLLYAGSPVELDVAGLAGSLRERGVVTCFPRVAGGDLEVVAGTPLGLRVGFRGIAEPPGPPREIADLDVAIVPGVAFDLMGGRLGQGGGHYDRLLGRLLPHTLRVGVGFSCQLVPRVPRQPHDEPVDLIVTEHGAHGTGARERPLGG